MTIADIESDISVTKLQKALQSFLGESQTVHYLACALSDSNNALNISYDEIENLTGHQIEDVLLLGWEWRLLLPVRTYSCHEWDHRILIIQPGEIYEMPNICRFLVKHAMRTGEWDSSAAIADFFKASQFSEWQRVPGLVKRIREGCPRIGINARQIYVACRETGFGDQTDTIIAVLKGAGIISPKLGSLAFVSRERNPMYEFNPCVYATKSCME